jgi:hypothetical protein
MPTSGVTAFATPSPAVVVIGHFDDRRAAQCPADAEACRDQFVVDRICWVDGTELEISVLDELGGPTASTPHVVAGAVEEVAPGWPILSAITIPGGRLPEVEPLFATIDDDFQLKGKYALWVVRTVISDQPVTFLVVDGTTETYRMTPEGRVEAVGDTAGSSAGPQNPGVCQRRWSGSRRHVAVVDASGRLRGLAGARDPSSSGRPRCKARIPVRHYHTGELLLTWAGSGCDGQPSSRRRGPCWRSPSSNRDALCEVRPVSSARS